jgi:hypothetical protein
MTEFSKAVASCIADWGSRAANCGQSAECHERSARQLRECLDAAFPDSKRVELESDKINYMLSSVFFLANRLAKASQGLAEFDRMMNSIENKPGTMQDGLKFQKELDGILSRYF